MQDKKVSSTQKKKKNVEVVQEGQLTIAPIGGIYLYISYT